MATQHSSASDSASAAEFLREILQLIAQGQNSRDQLYPFFQANQDHLDESLLQAIPQVFAELTSEQTLPVQRRISLNFVTFADRISEFPLGNRALNLEMSITSYELTLTILTRNAFPEDWARVQNNLAVDYGNRIRGERAENLEQAIACYEAALQVRTHTDVPVDWAMTQNNLGNTYRDRIRGDRAENLERAIACCEAALQVRTRTDFPVDWAMTQNNLGNAYCDRIRGERAENLERAIACYEAALQVRTRTDFPVDWAMTQNNLGTAYKNRIRGERAENLERAFVQTSLEQAIACYEAALQVHTRTDFPVDWATTQNNLGAAYQNRIRGDRAENLERAIVQTSLEQAIACYEAALQIYTRTDFPVDWATTQGNLAQALMDRAALMDTASDLDTAIRLFQQALEEAVPGSSFFVNDQYHLGNALSRRYETRQDPVDLHQAIQAYQAALAAISPEHYDRPGIWQAIPATQSILGSRLVREGRWQEGLQLLLHSVQQLSQSEDALAHANALFQTGRAHETLANWDNARLYYRDALRLYEHLGDTPGIAQSRAGLGSVLLSQGFLDKGMAALAAARDLYQQLGRTERAAEIESLYQMAERVRQGQGITKIAAV